MSNPGSVQIPAHVLEGILRRLDALEREQRPQVEQLTPNYLTVSPSGAVGANFTGHVHAQGLDLDEAPTGTPPAQDKIRWLAGGVSQEEIVGFSNVFGHQLMLVSSPDANNDASLLLTAGLNPASISATVQHSASFANINFIDSTGASDFLQAAKALSELANSTGAGAASLGANSPAGTPAQPYTWLQAKAHDGTPVFIPAWA